MGMKINVKEDDIPVFMAFSWQFCIQLSYTMSWQQRAHTQQFSHFSLMISLQLLSLNVNSCATWGIALLSSETGIPQS